NPFNPTTTIRFSVDGYVSLQIYDITGRLVETLIEDRMPIGDYEVRWDASEYSSGLYFIRLSLGDKTYTRKTLLLK
nr:T9SS type A sorting domain-containing protein [Candidatus Desulfolinea nitratireducens]